MLNGPVSLVIAVGMLAGAGAAPRAAPTLVVTATAPIPAAFMKFLREYFIASPLMLLLVFVSQELNNIGGQSRIKTQWQSSPSSSEKFERWEPHAYVARAAF